MLKLDTPRTVQSVLGEEIHVTVLKITIHVRLVDAEWVDNE